MVLHTLVLSLLKSLISRLSHIRRRAKMEKLKITPFPPFFCSLQGRKKKSTVHVGPTNKNTLFNFSLPHFHLNQITEINLLLLPFLPPQFALTKHTYGGTCAEGQLIEPNLISLYIYILI